MEKDLCFLLILSFGTVVIIVPTRIIMEPSMVGMILIGKFNRPTIIILLLLKLKMLMMHRFENNKSENYRKFMNSVRILKDLHEKQNPNKNK